MHSSAAVLDELPRLSDVMYDYYDQDNDPKARATCELIHQTYIANAHLWNSIVQQQVWYDDRDDGILQELECISQMLFVDNEDLVVLDDDDNSDEHVDELFDILNDTIHELKEHLDCYFGYDPTTHQ